MSEQDAWARALLVVPPVFPEDAPKEILPVEIRVTGTITTSGIIESPTFTSGEGREKFVLAVTRVLPNWRFRPAIDVKTCTTKESRAVVAVYFELKDGVPTVSVSSPIPPSSIANTGNVAGVKFTKRAKVRFPYTNFVAGIEGGAEVLLAVNEEGEIVQKTVVFSLPNALFGDAASEGLSSARFEKQDKAKCLLVPVKFCLEGDVRFKYSRCP